MGNRIEREKKGMLPPPPPTLKNIVTSRDCEDARRMRHGVGVVGDVRRFERALHLNTQIQPPKVWQQQLLNHRRTTQGELIIVYDYACLLFNFQF